MKKRSYVSFCLFFYLAYFPNIFAMNPGRLQVKEPAHAFCMKELELALPKVDTQPAEPYPFCDFCLDVQKRYYDFQLSADDLLLISSDPEYKQEVEAEFFAIEQTIANENALFLSYLATTKIFNSPDDITQEIIERLKGYLDSVSPELFEQILTIDTTSLESYNKTKKFLFRSIKAIQNKRFTIQKTKDSNQKFETEYSEILNGTRNELSVSFFEHLRKNVALLGYNEMYDIAKEEDPDDQTASSVAADIFFQIIQDFNERRMVLPLLIRYFGDIAVVGIF